MRLCFFSAWVIWLVEGDKDFFQKPPDSRPNGCLEPSAQEVSELTDLKVSIIIPWHKEKWLHLRDTLQSVVHYTPDELLEEIIFMSDGNVDTYEKELTAISSKVKVHGFKKRQGLIRAKAAAVAKASAPVIMFLEGHCIVNRHWLPPLLRQLVKNPKALVMPTLDVISQTDWYSYRPGPAAIHWRFEWNMNLINSNPGGILKRDQTKPYTSPGTSGGIFVMRKDWFNELGFFDVGMLEWGGDHVELSFKTWRCGGRIEIVPCSRIGHLFRDEGHRPYPVDVNQVVKNYGRLAQVWWKDHLPFFYRMKPEAKGMKHTGMEDVHARYSELTERIGCKNHTWYLKNIDHEMAYETKRICHPHITDKNNQDYCDGPLAPGRFTITTKSMISKEDYVKRRKAAVHRMKLEKNQTEALASKASDEL